MFKKRLKGLLAMVLAGSIAMTTLPLSASATFSGNITITDEGGGTVEPEYDIVNGYNDFYSGCLANDNSRLTANNLWAISYKEGSEQKLECVAGNDLFTKLKTMKESDTTYSDTQIKSEHDIFVTTANPSEADITTDGNTQTVSVFTKEIDISSYNTALQEVTSWTAWYGVKYGTPEKILKNTVSQGATTTVTSGSNKISVVVNDIKPLYNNVKRGNYSTFDYGVTVIQLNTEYKTFEIPVYDGWGKLTDDVISVTNTSTGDLIPKDKTTALKGEYVLVYDGTEYYYGLNNITNKDELWSVIETVYNDNSEFDVSKAKLVRYVSYSVNAGDDFTSLDLLNSVTNNSGINYLNARKNDEYIWKIDCDDSDSDPSIIIITQGNSFDTTMKQCLQNYYCKYTVSLSLMDTIYVTKKKPSMSTPNNNGEYKLSGSPSEYSKYNVPEGKYPVNISDITTANPPTAGKKYGDWEFWPCYNNSGSLYTRSKATAPSNTKVTFAYYQDRGDYYSVLLYFPEVEIKPEITVTAPVVGNAPATTASTTDTIGGYSVDSVKWYDGSTELNSDKTFDYEKQYTVKVTLKPDAGLQFASTTPATINGNNAATTLNSTNGKLEVSYTFAAVSRTSIDSAAITVTPPDDGATPADATAPANGGYTVLMTEWREDTLPIVGNFVAGKVYEVVITLNAADGYKFTNATTVKINGATPYSKTLNDNGTLVVNAFFTATDGWNTILGDIDNILNGDNPVIPVPAGNPTIPKEILEKIKDKGRDVVIDYGDYQWTIVADTIDLDQIPEEGIDLSIQNKDGENWATVINNITGDRIRMQISIRHNGNLGFTAYLQIDLTDVMNNVDLNGRYYANLYLVNNTNNSLDWKAYSDMTYANGKWSAKLEFNHCSDWLITIDTRNMNPALNTGGGSISSGSGSSSEPLPSIEGVSMTWSQVKNYLTNQLAVGDKVTIEMNGITTVPSSVIKVIGERDIKTTFYVDSIRSWIVDGAEIETAAAADLTINKTTSTKPDGLRGIEGTQFSINGTNIPSGIQITFKPEHAGKFANLYKAVDGKLVFVSCGIIGKNGKVILPDVYEKGDYIAMICEFSDLLGDINNDSFANAKDSLAALKHFLGIEDGKNLLVADLNNDGIINAKDSLIILRRFLEIA